MSEQSNPKVTRRDFVKHAGVAVGGVAASGAVTLKFASAGEAEKIEVPHGLLGRTGVSVSRLGLGCSHFQREYIDAKHVREVLHEALDLGVNYFDVAPNYGNPQTGFSEEKMGPSVPEIRDRMFLVTKTEEPTYEGTWKLLRQSMKRLKTDHFDMVHLHNFGHEPRFPDLELTLSDKGALGALREAKRKGVIRFIGASGHLHPSRFHAVLDTGEIDVLMNAVNFVARHVYDFEDKVWSRARHENLGLVAMKVLGGQVGKNGYRIPEQHYQNAIRYALSVPGVSLAVIGLANVSELRKAAQTVARFEPFSEEEAHALAQAGLELAGGEPWKTAYGTPVT